MGNLYCNYNTFGLEKSVGNLLDKQVSKRESPTWNMIIYAFNGIFSQRICLDDDCKDFHCAKKKTHKQNIFTSVYLPSPSGTAQAPTGWQTGRLTNIFIVVCLLE